jgi:hypothetical protein
LASLTCIKRTHRIRFGMQLYASRNIHSLCIIHFLESLLEGLQDFPTFEQIISLKIELKCLISDDNRGHIIQELQTWVEPKT